MERRLLDVLVVGADWRVETPSGEIYRALPRRGVPPAAAAPAARRSSVGLQLWLVASLLEWPTRSTLSILGYGLIVYLAAGAILIAFKPRPTAA